jgi:hypothetical protein
LYGGAADADMEAADDWIRNVLPVIKEKFSSDVLILAGSP